MFCGGCKSTASKLWTLFFTVFFLLAALIMGLLWPQLARDIVNKQLVLEEGSQNYDSWLETPIPMYLEIFMFNWTNADQVHDHSVKPNFVELGPYVFEERHTRTHVVWNDNHTVSFSQIRTWHFVESMSNNLSLSDEITTLNVIPLTVAYILRDYPELIKGAVSALMMDEIAPLMLTKTVQELIFDGYDDQLLDILTSVTLPNVPTIPFKRFGWFVERNGTDGYDGNFTMHTGKDDISKLGILELWNGQNTTGHFRDKCNDVRGTTGELWPPMSYGKNVPDITLFTTDLCRTITLTYQSQVKVHGLSGNRWVGDDKVFDNGAKYPETSCYCTAPVEQCPDIHTGVTSISTCKFGAPVFASYPHFYLADPYYLQGITGLNPSKDHEFAFEMEPSTGIPLSVRAQLQINLFLHPIPGFTKYDHVPELMIPMIWFRQLADLTEDLAKDAKLAVMLPSYGVWTAYGLAAIGVIIFITALLVAFFARRNAEDRQELLS